MRIGPPFQSPAASPTSTLSPICCCHLAHRPSSRPTRILFLYASAGQWSRRSSPRRRRASAPRPGHPRPAAGRPPPRPGGTWARGPPPARRHPPPPAAGSGCHRPLQQLAPALDPRGASLTERIDAELGLEDATPAGLVAQQPDEYGLAVPLQLGGQALRDARIDGVVGARQQAGGAGVKRRSRAACDSSRAASVSGTGLTGSASTEVAR
jgi:hypothetical protein